MIEIRNRWTNAVVYTSDASTVRAALAEAIAKRVNLRGSDLRDSNLRDSDLSGSNLSGSDLRGSDLRGSNLRDSNLRGSNLSGCDLSGSDLGGSDLRDSDLRGSNLRDSDLGGSNLSRCDLRDSNLSGARNLPGDARADLFAVLDAAPHEVPALLAAVREGRINGTVYEGDCACLVGTIANARHCNYRELPGIAPDAQRPAEQWFLHLMPGHTEAVSTHAALTVQWIEAWMRAHPATAGGE